MRKEPSCSWHLQLRLRKAVQDTSLAQVCLRGRWERAPWEHEPGIIRTLLPLESRSRMKLLHLLVTFFLAHDMFLHFGMFRGLVSSTKELQEQEGARERAACLD